MKNRVAIVCFLILICSGVFAQDLFNPIKDALKTGNAREVIRFFNSTVDMNVEGNIDTYSKAQAEFVLRDFFKKHPPADFSIVHTGSSKGGLQFAIGRYISNSDSYNVLLRVKEVNGENLIHEINFVKE